MPVFILTAFLTGLLFGIMDGTINGNPYGRKLMECYKPIARQNVNITAGLLIDIFYGFAICGIYLVVRSALPSETGITRGLAFGFGMWFFRVLMGVISEWMMFNIPGKVFIYRLYTGLIEMLILGVFIGAFLK